MPQRSQPSIGEASSCNRGAARPAPAGRIGLIAGAGALPLEAARRLSEEGHRVCAVAFEGLCDPALVSRVEALRWVRLGQLSATHEAMRAFDIERVLVLGQVPRSVLSDASGRFEPDAQALALLRELADLPDESLMTGLGAWLEGRSIEVCAQDAWLSSMLAEEGAWTARAPSAAERSDLEAGRPALAELGRGGSGQCVVVNGGRVVALEERAGTDDAIRRACDVAGPGATVVKAARPGQDRRFDLPTVGPQTIEVMREAGATALAVEAGATLVVARERLCRAADAAGIAVWGFPVVRGGA